MRLRLCRVRVQAGAFDEVLYNVHERRMIKFLRSEEGVWHNGQMLTCCLVGVPKGDVVAENFSARTCTFTLILNAFRAMKCSG